MFTTPVKIKGFTQYCFQALGNDSDEDMFYSDFMGVVFMENLVVIDIQKELNLTLSPD